MVHLMTGQKKLKDQYKYPDVLPKIDKSDMAGTMEAIKEYMIVSWCHSGTFGIHYKEDHESADLW